MDTVYIVLPDGMEVSKLRQIANYITRADDIIGQMLSQSIVSLARDGIDVTEQMLEFVTGKEMQADLRKWADQIEEYQQS